MSISLSLEMTQLAISYMDIPTLLNFRQTSRTSLKLVRSELVTTLFFILGRFVPNPSLLLAKLDTHGGFISGSAALQFFLRHTNVQPNNVDIYLPYDSLPPLLHHMFTVQAGLVLSACHNVSDTLPHILAEQVIRIRTPYGDVNLWQSNAHTPFLPMACGPTSAHILYVNSTHFGCGYPGLLFQNRAIVGHPGIVDFDLTVNKCKNRHLDLRLFTNMWRDLAHQGSCAAKQFACPAQEQNDVNETSPSTDTAWNDVGDDTPTVDLWVPNEMFHRLQKILSYSDPTTATFNLADVPANCEWGSGVDAAHLVLNDSVVNIWAVGHLRSMWFVATEDDPRPRTRVSLELLRETDCAAVRRLMQRSELGLTEARTWLGHRDFCADKTDSRERKVFKEIYDATTSFQNKRNMAPLVVTDLSVGDLVLVECSLVRIRLDKSAKGRWWTTWTTAFQLHALSLLMSGPARNAVASDFLGCTFSDVL
ncbi:hypothetical protein VTO73DRAFT_1773 [Trametes versicolor]